MEKSNFVLPSQDHKDTPDRSSFKNYRDPKCRSRKSRKVTSILKRDHVVNMRKLRKMTYSKHCSKLKYVPHSDFPSSPRLERTSFHCDNSIACHYKFKKREITTIQEEVMLFKSLKSRSSRKDKKAYKDKVASLKSIVKRLKEMGVAKSENAQNKQLPEDVMQLFSGIQL